MPYDSNGNFGLDPGYRGTTGQTITVSQHNPPLEDIAAGLSQVLLRSGVAPMGAPLNMNGFTISNLPAGAQPGDPVLYSQLQSVIDTIAAIIPTGTVLGFRRTTAPTGWVKESGGTIGNATSGATARANADTANLFTLLWTQFDNTKLPIQSSTGVATTRGASAAADYAANKRMPLFDSRTRFHRGADDGLAYDVSLTVGAAQSDVLKAHTHTGTTASSGAHTHGIAMANADGGATSVTGTGQGRISTFLTDSDGAHTHTFTTNSTGDVLETRPRSSVLLFCIKL